jgi:hypothetical protein
VICNHHKDEKKTCSCVATFDAIVEGESIPKLEGYCAIARETARHPELLTSFASDLILWDRIELTDYTGPFLWVLRDSGTVLLKPMARDNWRAYDGRLTVKGIRHAFSGWALQSWFWWDGRTLRAVSPDEAETLVREAEEDASEALQVAS